MIQAIAPVQPAVIQANDKTLYATQDELILALIQSESDEAVARDSYCLPLNCFIQQPRQSNRTRPNQGLRRRLVGCSDDLIPLNRRQPRTALEPFNFGSQPRDF